MHVRLPKPLHGWRAFAGEVGIIVLGVLIALGFGQVVEQWQWRQEVGTTRQAIDNELAVAARQAAERLAVEDCLHQRIGELAARLNASDGQWAADPMPAGSGTRQTPHWDKRSMERVYVVPLWGWSQDAWDTAKSNGVLNHMGHAEIAAYSDVYGEIAAIRESQAQELALESSLSFLSADQRLDNGSRIDALGRLGQLDALNSVNAGLSSLILDQIRAIHLRVDEARFARELRSATAEERRYRGACVRDVRVEL
jgi:hypothetical protein